MYRQLNAEDFQVELETTPVVELDLNIPGMSDERAWQLANLMTVKGLRKLAGRYKIAGRSKLRTKGEIVWAIIRHENAA